MVDVHSCDDVASELNSKADGVVAIATQADTTSWEQQLAAYEAGKKEFGRVDYFFANAGIAEKRWIPHFEPSTAAERPITKPNTLTLDINLDGQLNTAALALQVFERQTPNRHGFRGKLVITSSTYGHFPSAALPMYATSKAGVLHFTRSMAMMYAGTGITVNAVCPGMTATNIVSPQFLQAFPEEHLCPIEFVVEQFMSVLGDNPDTGRAISTHGREVWDQPLNTYKYETCRPSVEAVDAGFKRPSESA
ncbi:hypothetical protein GYMLUDRAFT_46622 [Collybiopsis luxurians FD-317 M1]|uniref:Unplaced genomic scaffold GYMLUscaffold_45, whole genome shotgun sequence n=1 Tax=Collybiopsis luxurians FD-317 M1 TaxID=944289 RepID=A0A0D0CFZ4_9AGAR|nr:hypothetical protein GYMLUDRAFT_46622 [Collybiopsis luxurians FD-317 M1]